GQKPFAVVLTCADSRLSPELIFDQGLGDLFVLRVAGNTASDVSVLGSIEYALHHFHTSLIVVLGHENCGAVKAVVEGEHAEGNLLKLAKQVYAGGFTGKEQLPKAVRANVKFQAQELQNRSELIKRAVEKHD